jgi:hypothetical protein
MAPANRHAVRDKAALLQFPRHQAKIHSATAGCVVLQYRAVIIDMRRVQGCVCS